MVETVKWQRHVLPSSASLYHRGAIGALLPAVALLSCATTEVRVPLSDSNSSNNWALWTYLPWAKTPDDDGPTRSVLDEVRNTTMGLYKRQTKGKVPEGSRQQPTNRQTWFKPEPSLQTAQSQWDPNVQWFETHHFPKRRTWSRTWSSLPSLVPYHSLTVPHSPHARWTRSRKISSLPSLLP